MQHSTIVLFFVLGLTGWSPAQTPEPVEPEPLPRQNVLVIVADDLGIERVGAYGFRNSAGQPTAGPTPNLDALAADGVRFTNAWSNPTCSPTRATMMAGTYSFRTGVGRWINAYSGSGNARPGLSTRFVAIPETLPADYRDAALGKWHLGHLLTGPFTGGLNHAADTGFESFAGSYANLNGEDYYNWTKTFNDQVSPPSTQFLQNRYATTDTSADAVAAIQAFGDDPWVLWLAYNTPHTPFHVPPAGTHGYALTGNPDDTPVAHCEAMIESMDWHIGRMLEAIDPVVLARTTIVFLSDNGTSTLAAEDPFDAQHVKGSLYNGGVNVPFLVAGAAVAPSARGEVCHALVNTTDLFATIAELTGGTLPTGSGPDSVSFAPYLVDAQAPSVRDYVYAEKFPDNFEPPGAPAPGTWDRAIRGPVYKLIVKQPGDVEEFYDVTTDYLEATPLPIGGLSGAALAEYDRLKLILATL